MAQAPELAVFNLDTDAADDDDHKHRFQYGPNPYDDTFYAILLRRAYTLLSPDFPSFSYAVEPPAHIQTIPY